jgi:hypothetical protein
MHLEAKPENCCSSIHVLKLDGRPIGKYEGRWFSESLDIQMLGRRSLQLNNLAWFGSRFELCDVERQAVLARAESTGILTTCWELQLSQGPAQLVSAGFFSSGYIVQRGDDTIADVDRLGFCENGWSARSDDSLADTDLLLVGLIFHVIITRRNRSSSTTHSGGMHGS